MTRLLWVQKRTGPGPGPGVGVAAVPGVPCPALALRAQTCTLLSWKEAPPMDRDRRGGAGAFLDQSPGHRALLLTHQAAAPSGLPASERLGPRRRRGTGLDADTCQPQAGRSPGQGRRGGPA
ncbi:unnamed protein product [Rangifer tarandus platyrhynchus]|uniref:Uncharacterized protein n=2 Tax=Rangifer tarandus platyrhynchus TaxID=3082113 RepID=A0ACB0F633_RANTA|nr:unnamed protein product [Rangifer tarandus platyrhynchus]CAI9707566.1 unnamed protein product [Rangifer tarandus platyrhynchus]